MRPSHLKSHLNTAKSTPYVYHPAIDVSFILKNITLEKCYYSGQTYRLFEWVHFERSTKNEQWLSRKRTLTNGILARQTQRETIPMGKIGISRQKVEDQ